MDEQGINRTYRMTRRAFLTGTTAVAAAAVGSMYRLGGVEAGTDLPKEVKIIQFSNSGAKQGMVMVPTIVKTNAEWRQQLSPAAFNITREAGTEVPYSGHYWNLHEKGLYHCICCDTALFNSETKFDSGTGWPSFWEPIARENVRESADLSLGMERTAVSCRRCDAHLGHVFDDGPQPTGLRYCMNSVALTFVKQA